MAPLQKNYYIVFGNGNPPDIPKRLCAKFNKNHKINTMIKTPNPAMKQSTHTYSAQSTSTDSSLPDYTELPELQAQISSPQGRENDLVHAVGKS